MEWQVCYLESVEMWLDSLDELQFKFVAKEIRLLEWCGRALKLPHSRALGEGLFELRERRFGLRIYYCFAPEALIVLLFAGDKSNQAKDIMKAREIFRHFRRR